MYNITSTYNNIPGDNEIILLIETGSSVEPSNPVLFRSTVRSV